MRIMIPQEEESGCSSASESASFFEKFVTHIKSTGKFDLLNFFKKQLPYTPPRKQLDMVWDEKKIKDVILMNICKQNVDLKETTVEKIMGYFEEVLEGFTEKITLQVLVHYTKQDIAKLKLLEGETPEHKYDDDLATYISAAKVIHGSGIVGKISEDLETFIKESLTKPRILEAFRAALGNLEDKELKEKMTAKFIKDTINNMNIYSANTFPPLFQLRGVALFDGIFVCTNNLAFVELRGDHFKADLISLCAHECTHYLLRYYYNDFNFSSPFKYGSQEIRFDPVLRGVHLKTGRSMELVMFDRIQPYWHKSDLKAAQTFLTRLKEEEGGKKEEEEEEGSLPIIKESEHQELGLRRRENPSPSFGFDIIENLPPLF